MTIAWALFETVCVADKFEAIQRVRADEYASVSTVSIWLCRGMAFSYSRAFLPVSDWALLLPSNKDFALFIS
jgi:hypothetical protein